MPEVSVLVVNYNGGTLLRRCLEAVRVACAGLDVETIVVDNASGDDSLDLPPELAPTQLVRNDVNVGFARAVNAAAREAAGRYWLLVNTDCFLDPEAVRALVGRLDEDPAVAVVAPRLRNSDGSLQRSCHNFASPLVFALEQTSAWRLLADRRIGRRLLIAHPHDRAMPVEWATGACWLVRPDPWKRLDGLDPAYFFYFEETDYCARVREAGYEVWFEPSAGAVHLGSGSADATTMVHHFFDGLDRYYSTHHTPAPQRVMRFEVALLAVWKLARYAASALLTRGPRRDVRRAAADEWLHVLRRHDG